jgi:uncharacterized protein YjbI with pentapeptide repeats/V8-like Glu-specific endopeptidase
VRLTGAEFSELETALRNAYPDYDDLALTLRRVGRRIQDITPPAPMPRVVLAVIEYAETRDWVHELIAAARASNPTNVGLLKVSAAIGLEPGAPVAVAPVPEEALARVNENLERMVDPQRGIADLGSFAAKIQELLHRVCAVELGDEWGTGFLIGPETVLTNHHVVAKAIKGSFDPSSIRVRFDYQRLRDGLTTSGGVVHELGDDWLVHATPHSAVDLQAYDKAKLPSGGELDYAVLRTREKVGLESPSGPIQAPRGWVVPRTQAYDFPLGTFLMVIQHPCHAPISYDSADDAVVRVNPNATRVHYRINTWAGHRGRPCLTATSTSSRSTMRASRGARISFSPVRSSSRRPRTTRASQSPLTRRTWPRKATVGSSDRKAVKLTSAAFETVYGALADAFRDTTEFERIARCMDRRLGDIVSPNTRLPAIIVAMIECAEADDAVDRLLGCAKKQNRQNQRLAAVQTGDLPSAVAPQEVAEAGGGSQAFKQRFVETLTQLDVAGMEVLAAHELWTLIAQASDDEARTLYLTLVGVVRSDRPPEVLRELSSVFAAALRREIGGKRRAGLELKLARVRLPRVDLSGLDLHEADLAFADLAGADLSNVNLWRSRAFGVDVSKAALSRSNLEEARWQDALAREARFYDCRMVSVVFKNADLGGARFQQSRLQGAHFERANLAGARFEEANVNDATFKEANIDEAAAASLARAANWDNAHFDPATQKIIAEFAEHGR